MLLYQTQAVTAFAQNCSVIWCDKTQQAAIIDPGGDIDRVMPILEEKGLKLEKILLTHGHLDHVGGVAALKDVCPVPVVGPHRDDAFWIAALDQQAQMMGLPSVKGFEPQQWLSHGEQVTVGQETLDVIHCPGHTPGHVVFYHLPSKQAFVGDVLFKGAIGRTDFPRGDHQMLIDSIRQRLFSLGDEVQFVPGHGPESNFGHERKTNPFVADTRFG